MDHLQVRRVKSDHACHGIMQDSNDNDAVPAAGAGDSSSFVCRARAATEGRRRAGLQPGSRPSDSDSNFEKAELPHAKAVFPGSRPNLRQPAAQRRLQEAPGPIRRR